MWENLDAPSGGLGASDFGVESLIELCMIRVRQSSPVPHLAGFGRGIITGSSPSHSQQGGIMNVSWKKYMKVGIVHFMAFPSVLKGEGPILESLEKVVTDDFFDVIEITTIKDSGVREKAKKMLASSKVTVTYGSQPVQLVNKLNLNSFDAAERGKALEMCKVCVDEAYDVGAVGVAFLSGADPGSERRQQATDLLIDSFDQLCAHASSKGAIKVVLETFDRDIDKKALIGPNSEGVSLSQRIRKKHSNFGLMLDLSHLPLQHETAGQALRTAKDHLVHAHMGNCVMKDKAHPAYGDNHPRFGVSGGENDVPQVVEYIKTLMEIGYLSENKPAILSFEVKPMADESSEIVIANAKRTLREAWELV
jgi:sugar phosphate isomerase/epimerase